MFGAERRQSWYTKWGTSTSPNRLTRAARSTTCVGTQATHLASSRGFKWISTSTGASISRSTKESAGGPDSSVWATTSWGAGTHQRSKPTVPPNLPKGSRGPTAPYEARWAPKLPWGWGRARTHPGSSCRASRGPLPTNRARGRAGTRAKPESRVPPAPHRRGRPRRLGDSRYTANPRSAQTGRCHAGGGASGISVPGRGAQRTVAPPSG